MGEKKLQLDIFLQQPPVLGIGYNLSSCWPKGFLKILQEAQAVTKAIGCFPQTESKTPLLKTTPA